MPTMARARRKRGLCTWPTPCRGARGKTGSEGLWRCSDSSPYWATDPYGMSHKQNYVKGEKKLGQRTE